MQKKIQNVGSYIKNAPVWAMGTLKDLRKTIKSVAPEAKESISYHMPYYNQNGRLAYFAYFKKHCSFFWLGKEEKQKFAKELTKQKVVGSTIQIPMGNKAPITLIKKIVKNRLKNNLNKQNNNL